MYRIHFDAHTGKFVIQIAGFLCLFWCTMQCKAEGPGGESPVTFDHEFDTYMDACTYATKIGLDQLYRDMSVNTRRSYLAA